MDKFFEWNHPNESMYAMCLLCSEFNGKMRRMFASNLKWTNEKKQQHTNNWEKRLNSNLTKWLNARVAPIFALRLRITAFLTFFCRCIRCIEFIFVLPCFRFVTQCTQQQFLCCWCFFFLHSFVSFVYSTIVRELRAKQKGKCLPFIISKTTSHSIWVNMYRR